jgi:hypothetical protein
MHSAILTAHPHIGIHANHMDMARFSSGDDPGFLSIAGELQRWMQELESSAGRQKKFINKLYDEDETSAKRGSQIPLSSGRGIYKSCSLGGAQ